MSRTESVEFMSRVLKRVTGIIRPVDKLGRVVIPKEYREVLGVGPGDHVEFLAVLEPGRINKIYMQKYDADNKEDGR